MKPLWVLTGVLIIVTASAAAQTATPPSTSQAATPAPAAVELQERLDHLQARYDDFADLARYRADDEALPAEQSDRVVFLGDSITDNWGRKAGSFFPGKPYVNRGISGQTTPQILLRMPQDVIHLHPVAVVILAGTNDIAGNTGPSTLGMIEDNLTAMAQLAKANHIQPILASVLPAADYPWRRGMEPAPKIRELNAWIARYCQQNGITYLDYYDSMADANGGMKPGISLDGVHPNAAGYAIMGPLAEQAIARAVGEPAAQ